MSLKIMEDFLSWRNTTIDPSLRNTISAWPFFGHVFLRILGIDPDPKTSAISINFKNVRAYSKHKRISKKQRLERNIYILRAMDYDLYLQTDHWKETRQKALKAAKYKCNKCNKGKRLQVHHLSYIRRGHEHSKDLIVLCRACHAKVHGRKK